MPRMKVSGPRTLPQRWPDESLWGVAGHDGRGPFYTGVLVSGGVVRSVPPLMAWMQGRRWIECAQECLDRGWRITHVDTELAQTRARAKRGDVQLGLDLDA